MKKDRENEKKGLKKFLKGKPKKLQQDILNLIRMGAEFEEDTETFVCMGRSFAVTWDGELDEM